MTHLTHVPVPPDAPGIIGLMLAYPATASPMNELADHLLARDTVSFSKAERETVAAYVSFLNNCVFCSESHAAAADQHWSTAKAKLCWESMDLVETKLMAYLSIARLVCQDPKAVSHADIVVAKAHGATDADIHDVVLIAAAFCMFNRYVDGLNTMQPPRNHESYKMAGEILAQVGYKKAIRVMQEAGAV